MTYENRVVALIFIPLGLVNLVFALLLPFLLQDRVLGFLLMGIPMLFGAAVLLLHGIAAACTRMDIDESGLKLAVPGWRGFPVPPARKASLLWDEVLAVRNRTEIYGLTILPVALAIPFPVNVFAIDTTRGRFIMGGKSIWLPHAIREIANRSGRPVRFEGEVRVTIFRTLLHGAPEWEEISPEETPGRAPF